MTEMSLVLNNFIKNLFMFCLGFLFILTISFRPIISTSSSFYLPNPAIIQQYARLHEYDSRTAGQQGPISTLTAAVKQHSFFINIYQYLHQIFRVGTTMAVDKRSEVSIPQGMLP